MPHEEVAANLWRQMKEKLPCHKLERLEVPGVAALSSNLASPYPLYHLIPV